MDDQNHKLLNNPIYEVFLLFLKGDGLGYDPRPLNYTIIFRMGGSQRFKIPSLCCNLVLLWHGFDVTIFKSWDSFAFWLGSE